MLSCPRHELHDQADSGAVSISINQAVHATCAKLVYRVYAVDLLVCPRCSTEMLVTAVINDKGMIRQILEHLTPWNPRPPSRSPPNKSFPNWPMNVPCWRILV